VAASTNFQVNGIGKMTQSRLAEAVKRGIGNRPGKWRVQFLGSVAEDVWEMCVSGPTVETTEYLDRTLGQLEPDYVASAVERIASH
jgi:hypothetical protein